MSNVKYDGKVSARMSKKVAAVKNAEGKVPYIGVSFDLYKDIAEPAQAWNAISREAAKYGLEHPQQSVYILEATPAVEEDAVDVMFRFMTNISKKPWAKDAIKAMHLLTYRRVYDVTTAYKGSGMFGINPVEMVDDFKLRGAFNDAYERMAIANGYDPEVIIHDNAPHFGVVFDIHAEEDYAFLKALFGQTRYTIIWQKVRKIMAKNGFCRTHGSAYVCTKETAYSREGVKLINNALTDLYYEYGFKEAIKNIKVVEFHRKYDVTFLMRAQKMGGFKNMLKKAIARTKNE